MPCSLTTKLFFCFVFVTLPHHHVKQTEQDYLNLTEALGASQHRVTQFENAFDSKQHELDDANRLIDEQNKTMEEYKKSISLLQANLAESKSDQSDLINALQTEWEHTKEEVMRFKNKCRMLQHEKDELIATNMALQQQLEHNNKRQSSNNTNEDNAEMVVLVHDLQRRLQQKEDEVASQEMLMKQLMEQQKAFQKRNKTLVGRLKAIKKRGGGMAIDEGFDTHFNAAANNGYFQQQVPETVIVEMKHLYDHYVRNPMIQTAEIIHQIRIKSASIMDAQHHQQNDYVLPRFNSMQINSASTILMVIEDILLQRQRAINAENDKMRQIISLKEEYESDLNQIRNEKLIKEREIKKMQSELTKYLEQINEREERQLFASSNYDFLLSDIAKLKKENERIAEEFLQGANIWNSEKAIMSAERAQIENDLSFIAHNLEQLILERQQFEDEADEFQTLYMNICAVIREQGFQIEVEYVSPSNSSNENSSTLLSLAQIDSVSNRRKQNTMKLKLYQATTSPAASIKSEYEEATSPQIKLKKPMKSKVYHKKLPPNNPLHRTLPRPKMTIDGNIYWKCVLPNQCV